MSRHPSTDQHGSVLEVEFELHDSSYPFVGGSEAEGCTFELAEMVPRAGDEVAEYFNVMEADPDRILALADDHGSVEGVLLKEYGDGGLFEFVVSGNCPAYDLAELGALPREIEGVDGSGRIVAEIPPTHDPVAVINQFLDANSDAELTCKREKDAISPLFTDSVFEQVLYTHLTDRQREVLRTAFEAGYYEWPRECTGEEVADELGIASPTFSEHIHAAERKMLMVLFGRTD